jgi:ribosome-binding protein aMBF1 (putative translation factor)
MSLRHCDLCGARCDPSDLGTYDERTGIYACEECVGSTERTESQSALTNTRATSAQEQRK